MAILLPGQVVDPELLDEVRVEVELVEPAEAVEELRLDLGEVVGAQEEGAQAGLQAHKVGLAEVGEGGRGGAGGGGPREDS